MASSWDWSRIGHRASRHRADRVWWSPQSIVERTIIDLVHDSIYGIYYQNTHGSGGDITSRCDRELIEATTAGHKDVVRLYSTIIDEHNISRLSVSFSDPRATEFISTSRSGSDKHATSSTPVKDSGPRGLHVNQLYLRQQQTDPDGGNRQQGRTSFIAQRPLVGQRHQR
jgi:hypothetical protein